VLKGLLAGGITMGVAAIFPEELAYPFFAAVLGLMAGVYPGIAMALPSGTAGGTQWTVALLTLCLALVGLWVSPLLLAAAWLLHGLWGMLHRFTAVGDDFPVGLPGFSLSFSLVTASFVAYMWAVAG
jgi:hypothetical protein